MYLYFGLLYDSAKWNSTFAIRRNGTEPSPADSKNVERHAAVTSSQEAGLKSAIVAEMGEGQSVFIIITTNDTQY